MSPRDTYGSIENGESGALGKLELTTGLPKESRHKQRRLLIGICLLALGLIVYAIVPVATKSSSTDTTTTTTTTTTATTTTTPAVEPGHSASEVEQFFDRQKYDHFTPRKNSDKKHWSQRYYEDAEFFGGPGHPIFVIMGGEDPIDDILYPYISRTLGPRFGAHTLCVEHRFYGASQPLLNPNNDDFIRLLSPAQALADAARLIRHKQKELKCGPRGSETYCPVMTVGGSYPGFLAVLMRLNHSDVVDIGYGSSSPLNLYAHSVAPGAYFEKVTSVAEKASPGCAKAVREALLDVQDCLLVKNDQSRTTFRQHANDLGICVDLIPNYITTNHMFAQELMMIISAHFAENNMGYYPPTVDQELVQGCLKFQDPDASSAEKVANFLRMRTESGKCYDLHSELPPGPNGTISASDWSGVGDGHSGYMWDYQSCTLIPECGMTASSMFPERHWTMEWLTEHCRERFGYTPHKNALVEEFGFDDLTNATRILFTNGIQDGWSVASITVNVSDTVVALNFPNGAHHSDLSHHGPDDMDTPDIKEGHVRIGDLISDWLDAVRKEQNDANAN